MEAVLMNQLIEYEKNGRYPFHMPGHKRVGFSFPNPFHIDITEIEGFDNLHHPEEILKASMEQAAAVYGADRTYYLINGSSGGILSAICGSVRRGGKILMARNCHKSAYHGVILNDLHVDYVYPQSIDGLGIQGGILAEDVENALERNPEIDAVLIVSPTYDGMVSDIGAIAEIVHKKGIPLIVDEAHGAHFPFGQNGMFPVSALECGADLVIQSVHKTLPSFTQTAVMHWKEGYVDRTRVEAYLQMFQSSSPSYVMMAGIELCISQMEMYGTQWMADFETRLKGLRQRLAGLNVLKLADRSLRGRFGIYDVDESKVVVSGAGAKRKGEDGRWVPVDGEWLMGRLRDDYQLEMEMCGADYVVAITTFMDTEEGFCRLERALLELDRELRGPDGGVQEPGRDQDAARMAVGFRPEICKKMSEAEAAEWEELELESCIGRISAEFVYLYPPGIPIAAPGERIRKEMTELICRYRKLGFPVQGMADMEAKKLRVLKIEQE